MHPTPNRFFKPTLLAALCALALPALATNGYFPHGYGIKASGMAGASTAMAQDSLGGATNPASMVFSGARMDLGASLFSPHRDAERSGALVAPTFNGKVDSGRTSFLIPEFGYNTMRGNDMSLGVSVYGNGGMNTTYPQGNFNCGMGPSNILCGSGKLGVDLMQLVVAPTVAYKLNERHSVGASLLLAYQRFAMQGVQSFAPLSMDPASLTNNGHDSSTGVGVRLGYMGQLSDAVTVGAAWSPRTSMSKFSDYKGLFADGGNMDLPANYSVGVAVKATPTVTVALDFHHTSYSGVVSVGRPSLSMAPLGAPTGPGFGWHDVDTVKLGVAWAMSPTLTLRAGFNRGQNPIRPSDVTFNILAPGVMKEHYTAGFTLATDKDSEISGALMIAPRQSVTGASLFDALYQAPAGSFGTEKIGMRQYQIGVAWARKF
ncbi:MAG TPA: outer membrane protein transport protein [Burkholderiaceae bacterium]|nr:outer membrane protein transport protein [Burkholderiaceae bacterium]